MNTFSIRLEPLIREFPEESDAVRRLAAYLASSQDQTRAKEFTVERIFELAETSSQSVLLGILHRLCQQGVLQKRIRVESAQGGSIKDFDAVSDIPMFLHDWRVGRDVEVDTDHLRLIYRLPAISSHGT